MHRVAAVPRPCLAIARAALLIGIAVPLSAQAIQKCSLNGAEVNTYNGNTTQGLSGIMRCVDADSGELLREEELRNGKTLGLQRYYTRGKLSKEFSVNEKGNKQGQSREFAPSGQVVSDDQMDNGSIVGLARRYDADGKLRRVVYYSPPSQEMASAEFTVNGQLRALRCADSPRLAPEVDDAKLCGFKGASTVELFDDKRVLHSRLTLLSGKKQRQEYLYADGVIEHITQIDGDQRLEQGFSPKSVKLKEERFVLRGSSTFKELERVYSDAGKLKSDQRWTDGKMVSDTSYYLNGQMKRQATYMRDAKQTRVHDKQFHDNGQLSLEGDSIETSRYRSQPVGVHKRYDEQGRLYSETHYDDQGRLQRERLWDDAGKLTRDDEVFEDGSRKAFAR